MTVTQTTDVTDKFSRYYIQRTAKLLVSEGVFAEYEVDDVAQDLQIALIEQASNFDPDRATWTTFVKTVIRLTAASMRRRQRAEIRQKEAETASLNVLISDEDGQLAEIGATVSDEEHCTGVGQGFVSHTDQVAHAIDFQSVLDKLTPEKRQLCDRLKTHSIADVAREMGVSKSTVHRWLEEVRERFRAAGLEDAI